MTMRESIFNTVVKKQQLNKSVALEHQQTLNATSLQSPIAIRNTVKDQLTSMHGPDYRSMKKVYLLSSRHLDVGIPNISAV